MKVFKKAAIFGITAVLACGVCALAACGKSGSGQDGVVGEVSDKEWQEYLDINVESCKSLTITIRTYSTYSKAEAASYGEWAEETETFMVNNEDEIIYELRTSEQYDAFDDTFDTRTHEYYYFAYKGSYYEWEKDGTSKYDPATGENISANYVKQISRAEFISQAEDMSNMALSQAAAYKLPAYKSLFKYNKETNAYDLMQAGSMSLSLQFLEDHGFRTILKQNSLMTTENTVSNIDKTTISVPASVKADVDAYIAEQAQEQQ